jgi:hypothetical protein
MLEKYFSAPKTLRRLRGGISGPHIDAFADVLERDGYAPASAVRYIRAAAHLGCFVHRKCGVLADIISKRWIPLVAIFAGADARISSEERLAITLVSESSFSINTSLDAGSARLNQFRMRRPIQPL